MASIFTSSKASEFVVGGAFGLEQFFGVGFEVTGSGGGDCAVLKPNPFNELKEELMECHSDTTERFIISTRRFIMTMGQRWRARRRRV